MREKEISSDGLKFEDLRKRYGAGRSYTISGSGKNRVTGYRTGVMTNIGDIEVSQWERLVHELISRNQEEELYAHLCQWIKETALWLHGKHEIEQYALELHADRIFDNPKWRDYIPFNLKYRPDIIRKELAHECE